MALVNNGILGLCHRLGLGVRGLSSKGVKGSSRLMMGSWNIGTLWGGP